MMKKIIFTIKTFCLAMLTIIAALPVYSQPQKTWQWLNHIGGKGWDVTNGITVDSKNNIYIAGSFTNSLECQKKDITSAGNHDLYIARFSDKGNLKWLWSNGGSKYDKISCIRATTDNHLVITGELTDSMKFNKISAGTQGKSLFIALLDTRGKTSWIKTIPYTRNASVHLLETTPGGSVFVAGEYNGKLTVDNKEISSQGKYDVFVAHLDPSGKVNHVWELGSANNESISALAADNQDNLVISGNFTGELQVNETIRLTPTSKSKRGNSYIIRYTKEGTVDWAKTLSAKEYLWVGSLKTDERGNIFAGGNFSLSCNIGDTNLTSNGRTDIFLAKYTPKGEKTWARQFGSPYFEYLHQVNIDNLQGAYIMGSYSDTMQLDSLSLMSAAQTPDAFIAQLSPGGQVTWAEGFPGTGTSFCKGAILDKKGNLYITGSFKDSLMQQQEKIASLGDEDIFIAKYHNCPENDREIENTQPLCPGEERTLVVQRGYKNIVWNDTIVGNKRLVIDKPGKYWVKMLDKRGCEIYDTTEIKQVSPPPFSIGNDTVLLVNETLMLKAPSGFSGYLWHDYTQTPLHLAKSSGGKPGKYSYWVCATDSSGCQVTDTLSIKYISAFNWIDINEETIVTMFPNPAGDYLYWKINTANHGKLLVEMADENGKLIHSEKIERYFPGEVNRLKMETYPSGIYYMSLTGEKNKKTVQFIHNQKH